jgi:hypothetical protein
MHRYLLTACLALAALASPGLADERPSAPHAVAPLIVQRNKSIKNYRLVIPPQYLKQLQMASVDGPEAGLGATRTILAGLVMTVAAGSCLLLLKPAGAFRWAAPAVLALCAAGAAGLALADVPVEAPLKVTIEVTEKGDAVVVTLPAAR